MSGPQSVSFRHGSQNFAAPTHAPNLCLQTRLEFTSLGSMGTQMAWSPQSADVAHSRAQRFCVSLSIVTQWLAMPAQSRSVVQGSQSLRTRHALRIMQSGPSNIVFPCPSVAGSTHAVLVGTR